MACDNDCRLHRYMRQSPSQDFSRPIWKLHSVSGNVGTRNNDGNIYCRWYIWCSLYVRTLSFFPLYLPLFLITRSFYRMESQSITDSHSRRQSNCIHHPVCLPWLPREESIRLHLRADTWRHLCCAPRLRHLPRCHCLR